MLLALSLYCTSAGAAEHGQDIQQNVDNLIRTNACAGCDLRGADLNRMILAGADLSDANLSGATFFLADLSEANLSGANLRDAKFGGADLANADLRGADLRGALLDGAFLNGSKMDGRVIDTSADSDIEADDISDKVYIPDATKPKEIEEQSRPAVSDSPAEATQAAAPEVKEVPKVEAGDEVEISATEKPVEAGAVATGPGAVSAAAGDPLATPKELKDQKKSMASDKTDEVEARTFLAPSAGAPPVKKAAPVMQAKVEETKQEKIPEPESGKLNSAQLSAPPAAEIDKTEMVAQKETVEEAAVEAAEEQADEVAEQMAAVGGAGLLIEKLLDTNSCYECDLSGVDLSGEDLSGADLEGADLSGAILNNTDLAGTNLKGATLRGAKLQKADLRRADLYKADLSEADLTDADFRGALTDEAVFSGAIGYQPPLMVE